MSALALGLAYPFLPVLGLLAQGDELAFPIRRQLLKFDDTDSRRSVQRGELDGSLLGGVAVVFGSALTEGGLVGGLLGLDAGGLMLAALAPGVLFLLLGTIARALAWVGSWSAAVIREVAVCPVSRARHGRRRSSSSVATDSAAPALAGSGGSPSAGPVQSP
ncbi:hypothetical protein ACBR40_04765 [Nonomuraea sp. AD125B]|uniref:hypothetical protein n=1 Tax=Nonomuraea sp. AD125B TaxID=3242897 RepID=UPI003527FF83